ncbi:baseplate assembly protein V [Klebsiella pneumoniae]|uniref:Baseplate assembly protein V n=1 Tax=Klebsiella pneumoniae TaxID=573 RepID=A0A377XGC8_KLEPN|nr:baseplate assembly protein V [Klebsiella pneumoniae]
MNTQLTEIMRLITNLIRTGIVTEVDRDGWLCRVKTGDLETNWINWLTYRAGKSRTWWCPSPGSRWCCSAWAAIWKQPLRFRPSTPTPARRRQTLKVRT